MARGAYIAIDGYSTVQQGMGEVVKSRGSQTLRCDIDQSFNFFTLQQIQRIDPVPRDLNGVPHRLCSNGHYSPVAAFSKNSARPDGLDNYCKECRHVMYEKARHTATEKG